MIHLIGPGGAGKTTAGRLLATRLTIPFVDLDAQFTSRAGDISEYLQTYGYAAYAAHNVQTYLEALESWSEEVVFTLSSGFMTYRDETHWSYPAVHRAIVESPSTAVLLPSFDVELCVAETVRRQLMRPFSRSAEREEQVIRSRFALYSALPPKKFETAKPLDAVVNDLLAYLRPKSWVPSGGRQNQPRQGAAFSIGG